MKYFSHFKMILLTTLSLAILWQAAEVLERAV